MWKAFLILFITSDMAPMSMMVGQFPESFVSKADCQDFVKTKQDDIKDRVTMISEGADTEYTVINHKVSCMEDPTGQPV